MCVPETLSTLRRDCSFPEKTLREIGIPYFDVVTARVGERSISYLFVGDAEKLLPNLQHSWRKQC